MTSLQSSIFTKDGHSIVWGDVTTALDSGVADASIDLIFADPPYNIGKHFGSFVDHWASDAMYLQWCSSWLECCIRKLKPTGSLYLMASTQSMPLLDVFLRERISILSRIVWHYDSSGVQARHYFGSLYEPILFCVRDPKNYVFNTTDIMVEAHTGAVRKLMDYRKAIPTPYNAKKVPGNVWYFPRVRYRMPEYEEHPSQKPEVLLERIIRASTHEGAMILDPFAGTFTTGAVAKRLGRKSISFEINKKYVCIGLRRLGIALSLDGDTLHPNEKCYTRRKWKSISTSGS
jgi:site-specific DNA-methyltransferase (adenine-specific)